MARITKGQKAERVLRLLLAFQNPRIVAQLKRRGFTQEDQAEGVALLAALSSIQVEAGSYSPVTDNLVAKADAWENEWFPIAMATLERRFPAVHAQVFKNLGMTSGPQVILGVGTFLERFAKMAAGEGSYGAEGVQAAEALARRGLTTEVLDQARGFVAELGTMKDVPDTFAEKRLTDAATEEAETKMWAWYQEWSRIARATVTHRNDLRQLGFLRSTGKSGAVEEEEDVDGDEETVPEPEPTPVP